MNNNEEFEDVYEDVVIENYGIPVVITDNIRRYSDFSSYLKI